MIGRHPTEGHFMITARDPANQVEDLDADHRIAACPASTPSPARASASVAARLAALLAALAPACGRPAPAPTAPRAIPKPIPPANERGAKPGGTTPPKSPRIGLERYRGNLAAAVLYANGLHPDQPPYFLNGSVELGRFEKRLVFLARKAGDTPAGVVVEDGKVASGLLEPREYWWLILSPEEVCGRTVETYPGMGSCRVDGIHLVKPGTATANLTDVKSGKRWTLFIEDYRDRMVPAE